MSVGPRPDTSDLLPLDQYDRIVVAFSGGKDSLATILHLLELGVPRSKIELWHHAVDGAPGSRSFMDWPVTESYCRAVAQSLDLTLRFSWREGGFLREMLRDGTPTAPTSFEASDGTVVTTGGKGPGGTRRLFPQVSADLKVRWCSAYLKIDVAAIQFRNDPAFKAGKFLICTGERRQESTARSRYPAIERHKTTKVDRRVDQWRPVIEWSESDIWAIIERHHITPHPAYRLGWGRLSCRACIFGNADQWATLRELTPDSFDEIAALEQEFGKTIQRKFSVVQLAERGKSYLPDDIQLRALGNGCTYYSATDIITTDWVQPAGAFKQCGGPT